MSAPEGYKKLAVIGLSYKGEYDSSGTYKRLDTVFYGNSTFVALRDDPVGVPTHDEVNWNYMAKGFMEALLASVDATDTSGLIGDAGATVNSQLLMDEIADRVATKLIEKSSIVSVDAETGETVPSSAFIHTLYERIGMGTDLVGADNLTEGFTELSSDLKDNVIVVISSTTNIPSIEAYGSTTAWINFSVPSGYKAIGVLGVYAPTLYASAYYEFVPPTKYYFSAYMVNPIPWAITNVDVYARILCIRDI